MHVCNQGRFPVLMISHKNLDGLRSALNHKDQIAAFYPAMGKIVEA